jgi:serine/threonine-protein kinase
MGLGGKAAALSLSQRGTAVVPVGKNAIDGPFAIEVLARVAASIPQPDRAIIALEGLLSTPYPGLISVPLTPSLLRLDPMFDCLRNDPRFKKIAGSQATLDRKR